LGVFARKLSSIAKRVSNLNFGEGEAKENRKYTFLGENATVAGVVEAREGLNFNLPQRLGRSEPSADAFDSLRRLSRLPGTTTLFIYIFLFLAASFELRFFRAQLAEK
jgi:hypothetical protein